jgi:hypothetical protein
MLSPTANVAGLATLRNPVVASYPLSNALPITLYTGIGDDVGVGVRVGVTVAVGVGVGDGSGHVADATLYGDTGHAPADGVYQVKLCGHSPAPLFVE